MGSAAAPDKEQWLLKQMDSRIGLPPLALSVPLPKRPRTSSLPPPPPLPGRTVLNPDLDDGLSSVHLPPPISKRSLTEAEKSILAWDAAMIKKKGELARQQSAIREQEQLLRQREQAFRSKLSAQSATAQRIDELKADEARLQADIGVQREALQDLQRQAGDEKRKKGLLNDVGEKLSIEKSRLVLQYHRLQRQEKELQKQQEELEKQQDILLQKEHQLEARQADLDHQLQHTDDLAVRKAAEMKKKIASDLHSAIVEKQSLDSSITALQLHQVELEKKVKELRSEQQDLHAQRSELTEHRTALHAEQRQVKEDMARLQEYNKDLQQREATFSSLVDKTKSMLSKKEDALVQKEQDIEEKESRILAREKRLLGNKPAVQARLEKELSKRKSELRHELIGLEQQILDKKSAAHVSMEQRKKELQAEIMGLEKELVQRRKEFDDRLHEEKAALVHDIADLEAQRHHLDSDLLQMRNQLTIARQELDEATLQKEEIFGDLEKDHAEKMKKLQAELDDRIILKQAALADLEKRHAEEIRKMREEAEQQLSAREGELKLASQQLQDKEQELLDTIKMLEDDEKLLHRHEEEFSAKMLDLEKDRIALEDKEQELLEVIRKLDAKEASLQGAMKVAKSLGLLKDELRGVKAELENKKTLLHDYACQVESLSSKKSKLVELQQLKEEASQLEQAKLKLRQEMEREREELETEIGKLSARLADLEQYKEIEKSMGIRQEMLDKKEEAMQKLYQSIMAVSSGSSSERSASRVSRIVQPQQEIARQLMSDEQPENAGVYGLIADARQALAESNLDGARRKYAELQACYRQLRTAPEEKKRIYFDVLELKTDIEIEGLE
ncbi:hypothetical protein HYU19_01940 [Candidatus Woesearchaeota archaeon]|nr:hypothetical protein [Candidatus Woesearchaeota archaeon]